MTTKHTPGPWSVKNDYDERHIVIANIDGESFPDGTTSYSYDFVCDTYGGDYESASRAVANANARLIAAAPELVEALQSIHAFVGVMVGRGPDATVPETITTPLGVPVQIGKIMRDAEAALAKAGA
jgi:hypothetical protein